MDHIHGRDNSTVPEQFSKAVLSGEMCANCHDAVTREGDELVGSDGEVTCPESDRPHGPAVPDTHFE